MRGVRRGCAGKVWLGEGCGREGVWEERWAVWWTGELCFLCNGGSVGERRGREVWEMVEELRNDG